MNDIFPTTQWTELIALRDGANSDGRRLGRRGLDPEPSADLLQDFFAHLLERYTDYASPSGGSFEKASDSPSPTRGRSTRNCAT